MFANNDVCQSSFRNWAVCMALVLAILSVPTTGLAQMERLRVLYETGNYEVLVPELKDFRAKLRSNGIIDLQVDFMLGVSMCRIPVYHKKGLRGLNSLRYAYRNLSWEDLKLIDEAIETCPAPGFIVAGLPAGGSRVEGKGGRSEILSQLSDMWSSRYRKRLFSRDQRGYAVEAIRRLVGSDYTVIDTTHFILVSQQDEAVMLNWGRTMERVLEGFLNQYRLPPPVNLVTVYLFDDKWRMSYHSEKVHGIRIPHEIWAYTFPQDSSITIWTGGGMGTVGHEVFHILMNQVSPYAPPWLTEGSAALYEEFRTVGDGVEGTFRPDHWRIRYVRKGRYVKLNELLEMDWVAFDGYDDFQRNHATAKFFAMYLQEQGVLERVVNGFRGYDPIGQDADGISKLERLTGMSVRAMGQAFDQWMARKVGALPAGSTQQK